MCGAGAGVLLRQFDKNNAKNEPWLPCPNTGPDSWCNTINDRWSAVLFNAKANLLYQEDVGGLILSGDVKLLCAYPEDGARAARRSRFCKGSTASVDL